jgi:hypothetical protein
MLARWPAINSVSSPLDTHSLKSVGDCPAMVSR